MQHLFVGIDDTDNLSSRGTGYRARRLAALLQEQRLARVGGITRHQLLVSPLVPYTSHNSSACLRLTQYFAPLERLIDYCRQYLLRESAPGSDAGLCVADEAAIGAEIERFGVAAQRWVLSQAQARQAVRGAAIHLEGLTGTRDGIIGALAAVGLGRRGEGGRFIWVAGIRELAGASLTVSELKASTGVDVVATEGGKEVSGGERVDLGPWPRPVLKKGKAVLLVKAQAYDGKQDTCWRVVPKETIKRY